jgi:hypothetical protein
VPTPFRRIPLRFMNRPTSAASVIGNTATWRCVCQNPIALSGRSGPAGGPTPETVIVCDRCRRIYFVIPQDRSHGPPIEVVELFGMPTPASQDEATPAAV